MTDRMLPEPHRYAVCAADDARIKDFYSGFFPEVFICLHPFLLPLKIDSSLFKPETYPNKAAIREKTKPVSWAKFLELSKLDSIQTLDIALRTRIGGLNKTYQNSQAAAMVDLALEEQDLIEPDENCFPEILFDQWLHILLSMGHRWVWLGDEHCTERKLHFIQELIDSPDLPDERNMFTHQNEILLTTHWDSHFTLICGSKPDLEKLIEQCDLEGFYCTEETKIYWSLST